MIGAECLLRTLLANEVDLCLMNPGTSEMQFVAALDRVPRMRGVLGLFEGVCSGAADGDRKSTRLNSSHLGISYAVFCFEKKRTRVKSRHLGTTYAGLLCHTYNDVS